MLDAPTARRALVGFYVSGLLFSFLGAMLPAWGFHLRSDYAAVGNHFLAMTAGMLAGFQIVTKLIPKKGLTMALILSAGLSCAALLFLAFVSGPVPDYWRLLGVFLTGLGGAMTNAGVLHAISPIYQHNRGATTNLAGWLFGLGCLTTSILVAGTFYVYTVPSILIFMAVVPGLFAGMSAKIQVPRGSPWQERSIREVVNEFRSPITVFFALLLFFQFGNEWSIAGWLALFLIQRLGISPESGLWLLSLYWLLLMIGRIAAQPLREHYSRRRILLGSVLASLFGCLLLSSTNNYSGAVVGILFLAAGYAPIYPLVSETISERFPYYHPAVFNGIFSFALCGALLSPWLLGVFAQLWGLGALMTLPAVGSLMVFVLVLLIWFEAKLSRPPGTLS